jgi:thiol-disulfide isomerase/thioredoxin
MKIKTFFILLVLTLAFSFLFNCKKESPTTPGPPALAFRGLISLGSQRLANVQVYLSWDASRSTLTDANGEFEFRGFSGSHFVITPSLPGHAFSPSNYELGNQAREGLNFTAQPASFGSKPFDIAADFSARNQNGQNVSLYEHFGKVILIDFSANWCGPCRDEAGHLDTYKLTFPVLDDSSWSLWDIYGEGYIPLNIVLDRNMTIRYKESGYDESTIINTIRKYL